MNTQITISQDQLRAIHNIICEAGEHIEEGTYLSSELDIAHKACAQIGQNLYEAWEKLPNGSPLKEIYRDDIWAPCSEAEAEALG